MDLLETLWKDKTKREAYPYPSRCPAAHAPHLLRGTRIHRTALSRAVLTLTSADVCSCSLAQVLLCSRQQLACSPSLQSSSASIPDGRAPRFASLHHLITKRPRYLAVGVGIVSEPATGTFQQNRCCRAGCRAESAAPTTSVSCGANRVVTGRQMTRWSIQLYYECRASGSRRYHMACQGIEFRI